MRVDFYKINEVYAHKYYKVPKDLFESSRYKTILNSDAKLLYALLLDRMELSRENGWVNERGEIYLIYTRDNLCEMLGLCRNTMTKAFKQLSEAGLIFEKRQGRGLPNLIFIGKIQRDDINNLLQQKNSQQTYPQYPHNPQLQTGSVSSDSQNLRIKKRKTCESRFIENELQDSHNFSTRETDINNTDNIKTEKSLSVGKTGSAEDRRTGISASALSGYHNTGKAFPNVGEDVRELQTIIERCELQIFHEKSIRLMFQHALEIMWFSEFIRIGAARIPQCMVRSRMYQLNGTVLGYALQKAKTKTENTVEIKNSTNYLITTIYNSITEYQSDAELDPELNRYLNADKSKDFNLLEGG